MTPEPETHPVDDLAAYAVDALDPVERAAVESHLAECAGCRHELDRHRSTLSAPAVAEEPPAGVWEGIATRLHDDAATVPPGPVTPPPPPLPLAGEPHEDDPLRPGLETREVVVVPLPPPAPDIDPVSGSPPPPRHLRRGDGARRAGGRGRSGR
ncbi:MAG TPA: zf-HC2 domain-containing protein, partial [Acidimicrobiales bacterium]